MTIVAATPTPPRDAPHGVAETRGLFDREILKEALIGAVTKLDPRVQIKNPVMFVVLIGTVITFIESISDSGKFNWSITLPKTAGP